MLKKLLPIFWMALFVFVPGQAKAQTDVRDVLIIWSNGDLWSWSEGSGITRLTDDGYHYSLDRSPDGRYLVYTAFADLMLEAFERNDVYPVEINLTNIRLHDLQTGEVVEIAGQPAEAIYNRDEMIGYARFNPCWSPDGSKIAWIQIPRGIVDGGGWQIAIYDVAQGVTEVVADHLPGPFGDAGLIGSIGLQWASVGLITDTFGGTDDNFFGQALRLYDENGTFLAQHYVTTAQGLHNWFWSEAEGAIIGYGAEYETGKAGYFRADPFTPKDEERLPESIAVTVSRSTPDQLAVHVVDEGMEPPLRWWMLGEDTLP
ncbi:MAG: hypothetical protein K8L91_31575 [Anaerolineae bacterium]|nr:hypothetical protein [Anaerolineae bacterium]